MYKKVLILLACIACTFVACQPEKKPKKVVKETKKIVKPITLDKGFLAKQLPKLYNMVKQQTKLQVLLNKYAFNVYHAKDIITSQEALENIFEERTTLIQQLHEKVLEPFVEKNLSFDKALEKELNGIGMQGIYAEGMYMELGESNMLIAELNTLASEPFRLYMEFQAARSVAVGGEYPFLNLSGERKMVHIGETLRTKYPENKYTANIQEEFFNMLDILTDVHKVEDNEQTQFVYGELYTDLYPFMTEAEEYNKYIATYPNSIYSKAIKAIVTNPSNMVQKGSSWKNIYAIVLGIEKAVKTDIGISCDETKLKKYRYLKQGIDVAHVLRLRDGDENICGLVYRFFSDKKKAEKTLATLASKHADLKPVIKEIIYDKKEYVWELK